MLSLVINNSFADEHYKSVKDSIQNRILAIIKNNYINYKGRKCFLNQELKSSISYYLVDSNLEELITCSPEELDRKAQELNLTNNVSLKANSNLYKFWYRIFYDWGYKRINNTYFIQRISVDTCPYCNRNYIYCLNEDGSIKPEIDHFYPSSIYPLFSVCYYNLIPSCQTCNGFGGKHASDTYKTKLTNPYLLNHSSFTFTYTLNSLSRTSPISSSIDVDISFRNCLQPHLKIFKLDKLYSKHKDHVAELILKAKFKYNSTYRTYLKSYAYLKLTDAEIDRLIIGNYTKENELHKRPLSKLYLDVGRKLGLIK